jgi:hypothetical protein
MVAIILFMTVAWTSVQAFTAPTLTLRPAITKTALHMNYGREVPRKNIRLPLLVDNIHNNSGQLRWNIPLPNSHLPAELTTASLYELKLDIPIHKLVISEAVSSYEKNPEGGCCYGHIVSKGNDLVGAIGCVGEVLIGAPATSTSNQDVSRDIEQLKSMDPDDTGSLMVLARGAYRFRVKEVVSSIPYPVAIVDEILDDDVSKDSSSKIDNDDLGDDDVDFYDELTPKELVKQVLESLEAVLKIQYDESFKPLSPLEQSILENAASPEPMAQAVTRTFDAEERLAVCLTFVSSLLDIAPDERDRCYAVAMMAGELAQFPSELRVKMLTTTNGAHRLCLALRKLNSVLSLDAAKRMTKSISLGVTEEKKEEVDDPIPDFDGIGSIFDDFDGIGSVQPVSAPTIDTLEAAEDAQKELKVGIPTLPPWAGQIRKGIRVEYFWNEEEGWCAGTVVDDPIKIMDEIVITVEFDDDGSVHRLPLRGEDKARWRPP